MHSPVEMISLDDIDRAADLPRGVCVRSEGHGHVHSVVVQPRFGAAKNRLEIARRFRYRAG
jgi:hypothetical protein